MATLNDLGKAVKAKYPGTYDDIPDAELGRRIQTKYPGAYDNYSGVAGPAANPVEKYVEGLGPVEGAVTAFGEAARHRIRQAANLIPGLGPSDAEVKEASETNAPLFRKHPLAAALGGASLDVPVAVAAGTAAAPAVGTGLLANALASGAVNAGSGAVFADPGQRGFNAAVGGTVGTLFPLAMGGGKNALKWAGEKLGLLNTKPTAAAQQLIAEGVPLTRKQMNPDSAIGQFEEVATSTPFFGPTIKNMQDRAVDAWRDVALKRGLPPGATLPGASDVEGKLSGIRTMYDSAYAPFRDKVVALQDAQALGRSLPQSLVPNPLGSAGAGIESSAVRAAAGAVDDAVTSLPQGAFSPPGMTWNNLGNQSATTLPPWLKTGDLQKLREVVRDQIRAAVKAQDWEQLRLLRNAQSEITATMEKTLGAQEAAALREIDKRYANFMTLENAAGRGGPSQEFTPRQLHAAVKARSGNAATVEGKAGELQDLAQVGSEVFDARSPVTGHRLLSAIPLAKYVQGPLALAINTDTAKKAALRPINYGVQSLTPGKMTVNEMIVDLLRKKETQDAP